jgi:hypothetical protein
MKSTFHAQAIATNTLHEQLLTTLACALGWGAVYAICVRLLTPRWLNSAHKVDWASRVVSTAHALILCLASGWHVSSNEWFSGFGTADRSWELWIQFSCGYFVYDALLVLLVCPGHTDKWQTLLHHCLALLLHFVPVCVYHVFHAISAVGYLSEASTPFLNARWHMIKAGRGSSPVFALNGVCLVGTFFVFRVLCGVVNVYQVFVAVPRHAPPSFEGVMGPVLGRVVEAGVLCYYCLNLYWFALIVHGVLMLFKGKPRARD